MPLQSRPSSIPRSATGQSWAGFSWTTYFCLSRRYNRWWNQQNKRNRQTQGTQIEVYLSFSLFLFKIFHFYSCNDHFTQILRREKWQKLLIAFQKLLGCFQTITIVFSKSKSFHKLISIVLILMINSLFFIVGGKSC